MVATNKNRVKYRLGRIMLDVQHTYNVLELLKSDFANHDSEYRETLEAAQDIAQALGGLLVFFWEYCFGPMPDDISGYTKTTLDRYAE